MIIHSSLMLSRLGCHGSRVASFLGSRPLFPRLGKALLFLVLITLASWSGGRLLMLLLAGDLVITWAEISSLFSWILAPLNKQTKQLPSEKQPCGLAVLGRLIILLACVGFGRVEFMPLAWFSWWSPLLDWMLLGVWSEP